MRSSGRVPSNLSLVIVRTVNFTVAGRGRGAALADPDLPAREVIRRAGLTAEEVLLLQEVLGDQD